MPVGEEFQPEAAIVNYFGLGNLLFFIFCFMNIYLVFHFLLFCTPCQATYTDSISMLCNSVVVNTLEVQLIHSHTCVHMLSVHHLKDLFSGDTLGGHLDDMEADWSKPIVSMRYLGNLFFIYLLCFQFREKEEQV